MNILFLEDEVELSAIGAEQLRKLGHTIYPALDLSEARDIVDELWQTLHLIIADHRLPDGRGIDYLLEVKQLYPSIKLAVVSGCLSPDDENTLRNAKIPFFTKPLLYRQVMQKLREHYMITAQPPFKRQGSPPTPPQRATQPPMPPSASTQDTENADPEPPAPPPKKQPVDAGQLSAASSDSSPPVKRKGLTSVIFSKLTGKD
ncbi:hypothetical protein [Cerasicoccus arenae]|uniref:Response regulatory domain-containing protein n=1 Tax=Cerasicoccus arenae TaxID=424488 RepID=A0A8J3GCW6_9BACT|nr:hypothetical protein [Cerasicoccus arenae]MBK1857131.1 hypothetical protein [Cerasicoccus arenae]GHB92545.1 hypothetical protein GCM10007047_04630 [Cerasicoccus arenae]